MVFLGDTLILFFPIQETVDELTGSKMFLVAFFSEGFNLLGK